MTINPLVITYCTYPQHPGVQRLQNSLNKWGWKYVILEDTRWSGFGRKYKSVVNHMKWIQEQQLNLFSHFISIDASDFIATGPPSEFTTPKVPLLITTEKGCWPDGDRSKDYPESATPWKYVNSPFTVAADRLELLPTNLEDYHDDQRHITNIYFNNKREDVDLDYRGDVIQSIAFCLPQWQEWFDINGDRISNKLTGSKPLFLHANGGTETEWWKPLL